MIAERNRKQRRCRPEIHSPREHPLRVAAHQEIFKESGDQEKDSVIQPRTSDARAVQVDSDPNLKRPSTATPASGRSATRFPKASPPRNFVQRRRRAGKPKSPNGRPSMRAIAKPGMIADSIMLVFDHHAPPECVQMGLERRYQPAFNLENEPSHRQVNQPAWAGINSVRADKNLAQRGLAAAAPPLRPEGSDAGECEDAIGFPSSFDACEFGSAEDGMFSITVPDMVKHSVPLCCANVATISSFRRLPRPAICRGRAAAGLSFAVRLAGPRADDARLGPGLGPGPAHLPGPRAMGRRRYRGDS